MIQETGMWHYEWNMGFEMLSNLGECGGGMGRRALCVYIWSTRIRLQYLHLTLVGGFVPYGTNRIETACAAAEAARVPLCTNKPHSSIALTQAQLPSTPNTKNKNHPDCAQRSKALFWGGRASR